jgi:acyl-CoA thioester hydrolase
MLKHSFETKVYYFDTDSYNIVWHGTYLKWFEVGRVECFNLLGEKLTALTEQDVLFPVVNVSVRYKAPARFDDLLEVKTSINKYTRFSIQFHHEIINKETEKLLVTATTDVAATDRQGRLLRKMPDFLLNKLKATEK